jgi:hypothetical protein
VDVFIQRGIGIIKRAEDPMEGLTGLGKLLVVFGVIMVVIGGVFLLSGKIPWLGKLPGDFYIQKKNFAFYFPLASCIILSVIISLILWLLKR